MDDKIIVLPNGDVMVRIPKLYRKVDVLEKTPTHTSWLTTISLEPLLEEGVIETSEFYIGAYKAGIHAEVVEYED